MYFLAGIYVGKVKVLEASRRSLMLESILGTASRDGLGIMLKRSTLFAIAKFFAGMGDGRHGFTYTRQGFCFRSKSFGVLISTPI